MARPWVAAGVLVHDEEGRLLMVRPTSKDGWDIPGGYVEPDESPADAARRELREELGVDRQPGRLLVVDWAPRPQEGDSSSSFSTGVPFRRPTWPRCGRTVKRSP